MRQKYSLALLLLILIFLAPVLLQTVWTCWIGLSVIAGFLLMNERDSLQSGQFWHYHAGQFSTEKGVSLSERRRAAALITALVLTAFGLRILYASGWTDSGVTAGGIVILPTYTLLLYPTVGLFFEIGRRRHHPEKTKFHLKNLAAYLAAAAAFVIVYWNDDAQTDSVQDNVSGLWGCIFVAAVCEELFFRSALYNCAKRLMPVPAACCFSALVFTLWHISLVQSLLHHVSAVLIVNLISIYILGLIVAWIYEKYGIIYAVLFHAVNNGVIIYFMNLIRSV